VTRKPHPGASVGASEAIAPLGGSGQRPGGDHSRSTTTGAGVRARAILYGAISPTPREVYRALVELLSDQIAADLESNRPSKAAWALKWLKMLKPKRR
jgi:hypothetical protein